jgi:hypothetical protein
VGQAVPEMAASVGGRSEVAVVLPGDVTLQTADDLHLREPFFGTPVDIDAGAGVRAHAGDHDPPQRMVGLAVTARVESMAGDLSR